MTKRIPLFLVLILSILTFGSISMSTVAAQEDTVETTFILHKLLFDFDKMPDEIENDGHPNTMYEDFRVLEGAEFEVYDVSEEYRGALIEGMDTTAIQAALAQIDVSNRESIMNGTTNANGEIRFVMDVLQRDTSAFLFHERSVPEGIRERAANLVVLLPFHDENGEFLTDIHLYPKNESENLPFEKEVIGNISYEIGERITYEIRTRVPENPQDYDVFTISDSADPVLVYFPTSLDVYIGGVQISPPDIYEVETMENGFKMTFEPEQLVTYRGQEIVIQYEMALSEEAIADENYFNEGQLEYDNNTLIDRDVIRTGGYRFVKVDVRDEGQTLADAHFIVRNSEDNYLVIEDGRYNWVPGRADATEFVSDENGLFNISGLRYGTYYLEETEAPFRYVLSETPIAFEVMNGTFNPRAAMNIVNQPERPRLPITGGDPPPPEVPATPVTPSRPRLPITRGEEPPAEERPRLPITGEGTNIILGALGVIFIVSALVILSNEKGKRRKNQ